MSLVVGALAIGTLAGAPAANASSSDQGTDPAIRCAAGAYQVASRPMYNRVHKQNQGTIQMMYSPKCGTNWVNIYGGGSTNAYQGSVTDPNTRRGYSYILEGSEVEHTKQVYAAGCVAMSYRIFDINRMGFYNEEGAGSFTIC